MNFFSSGAFVFGMLSIVLMIIVYKLDKHDAETAARRAARAKAQRIRELQALAMEHKLERDRMVEEAQYYEHWEVAE
jgi:hypothetical protein